jgi:hypothetical protein
VVLLALAQFATLYFVARTSRRDAVAAIDAALAQGVR